MKTHPSSLCDLLLLPIRPKPSVALVADIPSRPIKRSIHPGLFGKAGPRVLALGVVLVACHWAAAQPTVTVQPTDSSVSLGATAQFTAKFQSSSPPMTYQWWFKDTALNAAINPSAARNTLLLTNVTLATNAGPYFAVASDTTGSPDERPTPLRPFRRRGRLQREDTPNRMALRHGAGAAPCHT
jgi:hypothetical protein